MLTLFELLVQSILTYITPVWSSTCPSSYLRLQVIQSKCLRVIDNYPRHTLTSHLHGTVNIELISVMIHHITPKCFAHCPSHPNPQLQQIENYAIADLIIMYRKYRHKWLSTFCCNWLADSPCVFFRLSLFLFIFTFIYFCHYIDTHWKLLGE